MTATEPDHFQQWAKEMHPAYRDIDPRDLQAPGRRRDLVVVPPPRPANEQVQQAHAIALRIALDHKDVPLPELLATCTDWLPADWNTVALAASQPMPTSATQCVVLSWIMRAAEMDR